MKVLDIDQRHKGEELNNLEYFNVHNDTKPLYMNTRRIVTQKVIFKNIAKLDKWLMN